MKTSPAGHRRKMSAAERAVWLQEESYWRIRRSGDQQAFLKLWDERFSGWPPAEPVPIDKDAIRSHPLAKGELLDYRLEPLSVREYGGQVVITLYRVTWRVINQQGKEQRDSLRVTHTWMKKTNGWHIIGGMGGTETVSSR